MILVAVALLPLVAQTSLPQAADQFRRAYRQLLIYDHEEYDNDYNYNNLEGSVVAASVVLHYDTGYGRGSLWSCMDLTALAAQSLGYYEGSVKQNELSGDYPALGVGQSRSWYATKKGWEYAWECMKSGFGGPGGVGAGVLTGAGWIAGLKVIGATTLRAFMIEGAMALCAGIAVLCIIVGITASGYAMYYGEYFE